MIILKSREEIERMRQAGRIVVRAHRAARSLLRPGTTPRELEEAVERVLGSAGAEPVFRKLGGRHPFPAACCVSVNEEVTHGVPGNRQLRAGDLVSLDVGCRWQGWCSDAAWTYSVGPADAESDALLQTGGNLLRRAIELLGDPEVGTWRDVVTRLRNFVRDRHLRLVEGFPGHGIGRELHEDPQVPLSVGGVGNRADFRLRPGLVFTIEPILTDGNAQTRVGPDGWSVVTADGRPAAHFEWTVALTESGPDLLTAGLTTGPERICPLERGNSSEHGRSSVEKSGRDCL